MRSSIWVASVLAAFCSAAPSYNSATGVIPTDLSILTEYFNLLSSKAAAIRDGSAAPTCDLSKAVMPVAPNATALPPPAAGLVLKHVAIGRGTQNYSCDAGNSSAVPAALGAIATLYNASCLAASYPDVLAMVTNVTLQWNLNALSQETLYPAELALSGHHYFSSLTVPTFDLNTPRMQLGLADTAKNASTPAPKDAAKGQGNVGYGAVPWLKLTTKAGATGGLQEVYRLNTAGGSAPTTCAGMAATFEVQYAAEYWFWQKV